ncbi:MULTISPECIES: assimilatory sulfite reductase (NADPH) flavoprotein subunit [Dyella]|uniref:Sulfite reductase [NADPH] flavoprotein alpha-component n=2 Tax=Dyella TaxID=231454 RepID=A0A4R0Z1X1_9GAMM|nr:MULTISPECIES: assimilatory sulfite reductase (NADPH) flavoprotein subunit [Dyella]TBR39237.1 assimilatory sulfite reductase (NADPH) flavoprotein subunit [Dyella terrae]TCI13176.1 assimilatory sulfite reductase (NADPH) flavoprotein subunit [Dyella soli]
MNAVVVAPAVASPLPGETLSALDALLRGLEPHQLYWVAARSAELAVQGPGLRTSPVATHERVTVLYGSQTGNARRVAEQLRAELERSGLAVRLVRTDSYATRELAQERVLYVVISTQGEGEPPDDARAFIEFLLGRRAPRLTSLKFGVLGLGDSSYPHFCAVGQQVDDRLAALGAHRLLNRGEADVDVAAVAAPWLERGVQRARDALGATSPRIALVAPAVAEVAWTPERPYAAAVLDNQRIVSRDSDRDVRHIELSLEGSGLRYEPGDALGIRPVNPPAVVRAWLDALHLHGDEPVTVNHRSIPLIEALTHEKEITRLSRGFIASHATASHSEELVAWLSPSRKADLANVLSTWQPLDLLRRYPGAWDAESLVGALRPLTPRLYSIASSASEVGEEVHLTVGVVDYLFEQERRVGAASAYLAAHDGDARVPVYVEPNERFHLPRDESRDIIMIGAGTGVAPYRGFVQERRVRAARGRQWLIFGNRHRAQDFLYQSEWLDALRNGTLTRLDVAFSRDTASKVYVQHRMRDHGADLYAWLRDGAHLYVCGDATHMAPDVHGALIDMAVTHGGLDAESAAAWLSQLMKEGRYARDVY